MQQSLQAINIQQILQLSYIVDEYSLGGDFIMGEASGESALRDTKILTALQSPIRFDGYIIFFLQKGHFQVDLNLKTYDVKEHSLMMTVPGNIIRIPYLDENRLKSTEMVFIMLSKEFISGLHLDFNRNFQDSIHMLNNPCISLSDEQYSLAESYYLLAKKILQSSQHNKKDIIRSLLSSLSYFTDDVWTKQISEAKTHKEENTVRKNQTLDRFIALVTEYHSTQRGMQFYADKLCLTPKYLSKIIKETSGRTGPEWIDSFVILESKNLLRYSELSIKEIAYKLEFPSSSVFHKFFKSHTGITPSDYRKGDSPDSTIQASQQ
ncbi:MAG TPA: hypothetical protein DHU72_03375 [Rikenellaceae bacterium]|nr:hypothetical protein [Rikenellaceae bacterium]HCZ22500.1 hypothetical protein [Rikenellaceae bacterium]